MSRIGSRALFLGALLAWLALFWSPLERRSFAGLTDLSRVAREFFIGMTLIQLAMVLLVAPAATAGALCVDKARGTLMHVLVTDLTDGEIVAGKLAAWLVPVLGMLACGLPVLALTGLMGGIDYRAVVGAYLVTTGVAILGGALAMACSVWARKAHQALLATYAVLGAWVAALPLVWYCLDPWRFRWVSAVPWREVEQFALVSNPFTMALAPGLAGQSGFFGAMVMASAILLMVARWRFRPVALAQANRPAQCEEPGLPARVARRLPEPRLDGNPVLWREWHRKRPARWIGRFWMLYAAVSGLASAFVLARYYLDAGDQGLRALAGLVNAWAVAIGLLPLSVSAATALGEERDRGSLDIIMATPLPTSAILWGKWWGTFAIVPRLAILPIWVGAGLAMVSGRGLAFLLMVGLILAYAAAITSLGLALATWVPRLGRVVTWTVAAFVLVTIGWPIQILTFRPLLPRDPAFWEGMLLASPFYGISGMTELSGAVKWSAPRTNADGLMSWAATWIGFYAAFAVVLMVATRLTFDRCLGRVPHRPRRARPDPAPGVELIPAVE